MHAHVTAVNVVHPYQEFKGARSLFPLVFNLRKPEQYITCGS